MCRVKGRGLICLSLTPERVAELRLPMMVPTDPGHMGTAFTVSIEARRGVTTGISAADRAQTIRVASDEQFGAADIVSPGHIFRSALSRAACWCGLATPRAPSTWPALPAYAPRPSFARSCVTMARWLAWMIFSASPSAMICRSLTIADLIGYRLQREMLVEEFASARFVSPLLGVRADDGWIIHSYRSRFRRTASMSPLPRATCSKPRTAATARSFGPSGPRFSATCLASRMTTAPRACAQAFARSNGPDVEVLPYVLGHHWPPEPLLEAPAAASAPSLKPAEAGFREFGLGAQVLRSLGIHRIRVLTNNPRKIVALAGFGIETLGALALEEERDV